MKTQQSTVIHPLDRKEVFSIQSWSEWKERWEKESCLEILHSLLHFGFSISAYGDDVIDRLCMYLEIANQRGKHRQGGYRDQLSQKGFRILCQSFFKNTAEACCLPSWAWAVSFPQILEKIFWFFRTVDGRIENLGYPRDPHQEKIARTFAREFCLFMWDAAVDANYSEEIRARPNVINLLAGLGELPLLFANHRYNSIDKDCLMVIENISLDSKLYLPDTESFGNDFRLPTSIKEACLGGSATASFLLILKVLQAEEKRIEELRKLECQRRETEEKIKKLI